MKNTTLERVRTNYLCSDIEINKEANGIEIIKAPFVLISVFDLTGKLQMMNKLNFGENNFIDLANVKVGEYLAVFESAMGMITYKMNIN